MRHHLLGRAALAAGLAAIALPGAASAAIHRQHGLTIAATPRLISAGQGVLIYGHLRGPGNAGQRVVLYHRINPAPSFTPVSTTRTNAQGYYEFVRADGVVNSNRNWFVAGPEATHSRIVHERVSALVTLNAASSATTTGTPVAFKGTVFPAHPHQRVLIQAQDGVSGNGWRTVTVTATGAGSSFAVSHAFRLAGDYTLRALLPTDARNLAGASASLTLGVQQRQDPSFTIGSPSPVIADGQSATITGTLYAPGSSTTPQGGVQVGLYGRQWGGGFTLLATATTAPDGSYSFTQTPLHSTVYRVRTTGAGAQLTAPLYLGVRDVVSVSASAQSVNVGDSVTLSGTVAPGHAGHVIFLQRQDSAGNWVDLELGFVHRGSRYALSYTFGQPGSVNLRVQVPGGPVNLGAVSTTEGITVSGLAAVSTLPPAS